jgi:type VI secretion system protein VasJ
MSLKDELLAPISADAFCGEDPSYESEFETAQSEANKISGNNWELMETKCKALLTTKSKDMRALGFLTLASALSEGMDAFADCVIAYSTLVREHWNGIHPERENGRANALRWLNGERVLQLLGDLKGKGDFTTLTEAAESLDALQTFGDEKFKGGCPAFGGFTKVVKEMAARSKPQEKPAESDSQTSPNKSNTSTSGTPTHTTSAPPQGFSSVDDCLVTLQKIANFLRTQNAQNPLAYRLMRVAQWESLVDALPHQGGETLVPAPYPTTLEAFKGMAASMQWSELVPNGEDAFTADGMLFWLDLQRYIATGMKALGGKYPDCAKTLLEELARLLQRLPDLPNLKFNDGTPFADMMTKEWIENEVKTVFGTGGGGAAAIKKKGDVGEESKQAEALLGEGKLENAVGILRQGLANDASIKNNFDRKLIVADLCFRGNKPQISLAVLDDLSEVIDTHRLESWDPDSCVSVYRLKQKACLALMEAAEEGNKDSWRAAALAMQAKISRLDPVLAVRADVPA